MGGGTGIYHGKISVTNAQFVVNGGVLNGASIPDGTDITNSMTPGAVLYCTQIDLQTTVTMYADDGVTVVATCTNLLRGGNGNAAGANEQLLWVPSIAHAADAKVNYGYMAMLPMNGINRLQGNGVGKTAVQTVGTSGTYDFGAASRVVGWNAAQAGCALEFHINEAYAPLRINGVQQAWSADAALIAEYDPIKAKLRLSNFQGSLTGDDVSGETHSSHITYRIVRADGV
jgi:hypothetical protein